MSTNAVHSPVGKITTKRNAPGWYTMTTPLGQFDITRTGDVWHITWPGERYPDAFDVTLADAKQTIIDDVAATIAG
jgi:hypothetical protein